MQRGTALMSDGDPLTPGWPSTSNNTLTCVKNVKFKKIYILFDHLNGMSFEINRISLIPGYAYRIPKDDAPMPQLPTQSIGYKDARFILR